MTTSISDTGDGPRTAVLSASVLMRLKDRLAAEAQAAGFDAFGIADPTGFSVEGQHLDDFLAAGRQGEMTWLADRADWRRDPKRLWPAVRRVIMVSASYGPPDGHDTFAALAARDRGSLSVYAARRDYHDVLKGRLKQLGQGLLAAARQRVRDSAAGTTTEDAAHAIKVFVDTAPVMEKPLAARAGIGWQGKHTNLVSRRHGSWTFLGAIFTTLDLPADTPSPDHCGGCRRCLDACPTDAFPAPYQLDARRCIAYLTVEHPGPIPPDLRPRIGNRIFGCDDCLAVCPWNKFATACRDTKLALRPDLLSAPLSDLLGLDDAAFRARFAGTPVRRLGRDRFLRNVLVAAGNSGNAGLAGPVRALLDDPSALVRGMAVWALGRLVTGEELAALAARHLPAETDETVRAEWLALSGIGS